MEHLSLSTADGVSWRLQFQKFIPSSTTENNNLVPNWNSDVSIEIKDPPSPFLWCQDRSVVREPPIDNVSISATVPGNVHEDLIKSNVLREGHPYYDTNELKYRWVSCVENWDYDAEFTVTESLLHKKVILLDIQGIDTVSSIFINGSLVGKTENMFRRYQFDVKSFLKSGKNSIKVTIHCAMSYIKKKKQDTNYVVPLWEYPNGEFHRNFIRKTACHFGWDWGPCFMTFGIYKQINILGFDHYMINYMCADQIYLQKDGKYDLSHVNLQVQIYMKVQKDDLSLLDKLQYEISCEHSDTKEPLWTGLATPTAIQMFSRQKNSHVEFHDLHQKQPELTEVTVTLLLPNIQKFKLWWPNGYGEQHLYNLSVKIGDCQVSSEIGFRSVKLVREKDGQNSESFYFEINNTPVFAKGANWIPTSCFDVNQNYRDPRDTVCRILESARECHVNMIRVWGGGLYESDAFYKYCNKFGIMLWHDMMFACALYPASQDFLENVREEVIHQVLRLYNHSCIVLYCANNENEEALGVWNESKANRDKYVGDYNKLYIDTIYDVICKLDPNRPFWPSSPTNGVGEWGTCQAESRGDIHCWSVWHGNKPFSHYQSVRPRFCSEFGFQSFPSVSSLSPYLRSAEDLNVTSPQMEFRQRSPIAGNKCIIEHASREFRMWNNFDSFVVLSQLLQAMAIKSACEYWRTLKPYCMGELYWQLNDIWPGPSWSSIDYHCNWKLLQYFSKKFFAPILICAFEEEGSYTAYITSDVNREFIGKVIIDVWSFSGNIVKTFVVESTRVSPLQSLQVWKLPAKELFPEHSQHHQRNCFMTLKLFSDSGSLVSENVFQFSPLKYVDLVKPKFEIAIQTPQQENAEEISFTVRSEHIMPYTYLDTNIPGTFSDNGFWVLPHEEKKLTFKGWTKFTRKEFEDTLRVKPLQHTYMSLS